MTVDMEINADMVSDVAINMASDISNTTHEWIGPIQSGPPN